MERDAKSMSCHPPNVPGNEPGHYVDIRGPADGHPAVGGLSVSGPSLG